MTIPSRLRRPAGLAWNQLPRIAQAYVLVVAVAGAYALAQAFPRTFPEPFLFLGLLIAACLTSIWKVTLPLPLTSGSTLSVSYAADLMALLLLGPKPAVAIAVAGVLAQCTIKVKAPYPTYRTLFSMAEEALAMTATGAVYTILGGPVAPVAVSLFLPSRWSGRSRRISSSTPDSWRARSRRPRAARGGTSGASSSCGAAPASWLPAPPVRLAAVVIARGEHWKAVLLLAPVYLTYRTYQVFVGRLEDQKRHTAETRRLHQADGRRAAVGAAGRGGARRREAASGRDGRGAHPARAGAEADDRP